MKQPREHKKQAPSNLGVREKAIDKDRFKQRELRLETLERAIFLAEQYHNIRLSRLVRAEVTDEEWKDHLVCLRWVSLAKPIHSYCTPNMSSFHYIIMQQ